MPHAEALVLVHNQQAQVLKLDVFRQQPVRADQDIDLPRLHPRHNIFLFLRGAEARNHFDVDGELRKPLLECLEMLKAENRGGRQHRDLFPVLHRFEGRAHGHFRLPIAHVAAQQPVHRRRRFHVVLDGPNRRKLVFRLVVIEGVFKLFLKVVVL